MPDQFPNRLDGCAYDEGVVKLHGRIGADAQVNAQPIKLWRPLCTRDAHALQYLAFCWTYFEVQAPSLDYLMQHDSYYDSFCQACFKRMRLAAVG